MVSTLNIFKACLLGSSGVGKTCLVHRFVDNVFIESTKRTIGVDFSLKKVKAHAHGPSELTQASPSQDMTLQLWDFAGEDRFRSVLPYYVQGTHGVLLCFDLTVPESLVTLSEWLDIIRSYDRSAPNYEIPILLIGMKSDLEPQIDNQSIKDFVEKEGLIGFTTTSAKTGENVEDAFNWLGGEIWLATFKAS